MANQASCAYHVQQGGQSLTALAAAVAAVPVPDSIVDVYGARVTSDSTATAGTVVTRTIVFAFGPETAGAATTTVNANGLLTSVNVTNAGSEYVLPPTVTFDGGGDNIFAEAIAAAYLQVEGASVGAGGSGYSASTYALVIGQQSPNDDEAVEAKLTLTIAGGAVTAVAVANAGSNYAGIPEVLIVDPIGSGRGASVNLTMQLGSIDLVYPGEGYAEAPTVTLTPAFKAMFPDSSNQATPFANFMTSAIQAAVLSPVVADPPVLS